MREFAKKFDKSFIENVADNPVNAIIEICNYIDSNTGTSFDGELNCSEELVVETHDLLEWIFEKFSILEEFDIPIINHFVNSESSLKDIMQLKSNIKPLWLEQQKQAKHKQYNHIASKGFSYHFSDEDVSRIQILINELRNEIEASSLFKDEHKQRLLKRLEKLQAEMHKKMSDVDILWGFVGDAGVVIGKFGKDAKPFVDRIIELTQITWKTQAKAEGLPEGNQHPLLGTKQNL